jgi:threonine aldolase
MRADCAHAFAGHAPDADAASRDVYGDGAALNAFEAKIAALLGKEAAVFMPSGTMAQQIALRIAADRSNVRAFAAHPTNHLVLHERDGFARLHGLAFVPFATAATVVTAEHVSGLRERVGTVLIELPQREIGGELPTWDELVAITDAAREHGAHVHLDGARLWECGPYYARPYAEIAALFDSVYVSFYKGIGALAGAMLCGTQAFVDEAKIWQRRHGGNLYTLAPYAEPAERAFDARIGRMAEYAASARRLAAILDRYDAVTIRPNPPLTNMFHAFIRGDQAELALRAERVARELGIWTIAPGRLGATAIPDVWKWEISCGEAIVALSDDALDQAASILFGPTSEGG